MLHGIHLSPLATHTALCSVRRDDGGQLGALGGLKGTERAIAGALLFIKSKSLWSWDTGAPKVLFSQLKAIMGTTTPYKMLTVL